MTNIPSSPYLIREAALEKMSQDENAVSEFIDHIIQEAIDLHASDIHFEAVQQHYRIRYRRDGLLQEITTIPLSLASRVITRIKILSKLDIAERRLPQDGRFTFQETKIDMRVSTCPTLLGEKLVIRLLNARQCQLHLDQLGFTTHQHQLFLDKLQLPQGLILVSGPTGSGKTMTLYSALQYLNNSDKNISTVEDPIELEIPGTNQVNIHPRIGLDFATILRALLRQDPDILMIGEIRDHETAQIALQAAQTGHLVLSTLHANSAGATLSRLQTLGAKASHLLQGITLIIAQRLVRILCPHCKRLDYLTSRPIFRPVGCETCHQGYKGRLGIFECLEMPHSSINPLPTEWVSLWKAGLEKVQQGITTEAELARVLGQYSG